MLMGDEGDHAARLLVARVAAQHLGHARDEAFVGVPQREAQLSRNDDFRIRGACVLERPVHHAAHELVAERGEGRAFGARQHHDHGGSVREAIVE